MSWGPLASTGAPLALTTYGSQTTGAGAVTADLSWSSSCAGGQINQGVESAISGCGLTCLQFAATAFNSAGGPYTSVTQAFTSANASGNTLLADVATTLGSDTWYPDISVSDSQGNLYVLLSGGTPNFQGASLQTWACFDCAAGANTVTVAITGAGVSMTTVSLAVHEYPGSGALVASQYGTGPLFGTGTPVNLSVTATGTNQLLHLAVSTAVTCPVTVSGGGSLPPIPPAVTGGVPTPTQPFFANLSPPPLQTPIVDPNAIGGQGLPYLMQGLPTGDVMTAWGGWFNAVYQFLQALGAAGGAGSLGAFTVSADYTAGPIDTGRILALNSATPQTLTLPVMPPTGIWNIFVQNIGAAPWTVDPNGLLLNGVATSIVLQPGVGVYISTDGVNYFWEGSIQSRPKAFAGAITAVAGTPLAVTHGLGSTDVQVSAQDGSSPPNAMTISGLQFTSTTVVTVTFGISFTGRIVVIG